MILQICTLYYHSILKVMRAGKYGELPVGVVASISRNQLSGVSSIPSRCTYTSFWGFFCAIHGPAQSEHSCAGGRLFAPRNGAQELPFSNPRSFTRSQHLVTGRGVEEFEVVEDYRTSPQHSGPATEPNSTAQQPSWTPNKDKILKKN